MKHFRRFLNNSYVYKVDDVTNDIYDLIEDGSEEEPIYIRVQTHEDGRYWKIIENEHFNIDTEQKKDAVFDKVASFIEEQNSIETNEGIENYGIYNKYY